VLFFYCGCGGQTQLVNYQLTVDKSEKHIITICLVALLFAISFFKDDFTPDYLNTPDARFIEQAHSRFHTLFEFPSFWLTAIIYSLLFCVLPYFVLRNATTQSFANIIFVLLIAVIVMEYSMIFIGTASIDRYIIPKVNRSFHSPLFTLFFLAAFTVNNRLKENG
jgi:hypothetical protein